MDVDYKKLTCMLGRVLIGVKDLREKARKLDNEYWNIIRMKLHKDQWLKDPNL